MTLRQGATFIFTLALLVGLIQIVFLAGGSLPGERLYTIKRSVEVVWIAATPEDNRGTVRLELLDRRVQEVGALLATGQSVPDPLFVEIEEALTSVTEHPYEWGSPNGHILPYVERSRRTLNALALMYTDEPEVARLAAASGRAWESLWDPIY
ncbi:MAG: hypothetical protein JXB35_02110 [Anaerolineae bacterium]|nr:hypothetical protein [Anaerolineae bacterium]